MSPALRKPFLFVVLLAATFLPLAGGWLKWGGLPQEYGLFPPQHVTSPPVPGFNALYFAAGCGVVAIMIAFMLFPRLFGFRSPGPTPGPTLGAFPGWFGPAVLVTLVSWGLMWFGPASLARWTFVPLWWGFIYALDGLVFALARGRSLVATRQHEMLTLAIVSVVGWYLFEYWNYFALGNWYYPYAELLSPFGNLVWYSLSYTTVWPVCFEAFMLLMAVPALRGRWADGPRIVLPRWAPSSRASSGRPGTTAPRRSATACPPTPTTGSTTCRT